METKQQLANLIDAYADAKRSANEILIKMAVEQLQGFLNGHDIVPTASPISESTGDEVVAE